MNTREQAEEPGGIAEQLIAPGIWAAAIDPSLPPGVIVLADSEGLAWRYPLAEFTDEGDRLEWSAG